MKYSKQWLVIVAILIPFGVHADNTPVYKSKYIGQEKREIKSLSPDDIEQLKSGEGWGLAKAAELNGMPGPAHVLQMKDKISLTKQQEQRISEIFNNMKSRAIPLGKQLVDLEKDLNQSFEKQSIDEKSLKTKIEKIASVTANLRYVHLSAHLETPTILTSEQIALYNKLRGYSNKNPCEHIPEGHDAAMWLKHNGCQ
jgi:Spy/CpxP family protein refolding chaperone